MSVKFKESTQRYNIFILHSNRHSDICLQSESDHKERSVSINMNDTLYKGC